LYLGVKASLITDTRIEVHRETKRPVLSWPLIVWAAVLAPLSRPRQISAQVDSTTVRPAALVKTEPVAGAGDAADDPAIWVHPTDPARSLILGTDKKGGLNVYALDGRSVQEVSNDWRPHNVDVLSGFSLDGKTVDLAVAGSRNKKHPGATRAT
jgi:myo-inositol-hexaphosphate 3-phosphohydrolase